MIRLTAGRESAAVDDSQVRAQWDGRERFLADCMKQQGFQYYPTSWDEREQAKADGEIAAQDRERLANRLPIPALDADRDVVARYGYGRASTFEEVMSKESFENPQMAEYYDSLSESEQRAFDFAMSGPDVDSVDPDNLPTRGCGWEAGQKYPDPSLDGAGESVRKRFGDLIYEMMYLKSEPPMEADKRLVALNREWRECMTAAGLSTEGLRTGIDGPSLVDGPFGAHMLATYTGADGVVAEPSSDVEDMPGDQRSLVGSEFEIKIALADYDCRAQTGYLERLIEVQRELEQDFVKTHRQVLAELEDYADQHGQ